MSVPSVTDKNGRVWQYHSRSDQHSKVACWAVLFDLLQTSSLLRQHLAAGKVAFGINRQINDWHSGRKKDLDLVVARAEGSSGKAFSLSELAVRYKVILTAEEQALLVALPSSPTGNAGATVLVALEAKACMTAHVRALPRLYDELTSSHSTVHGDNGNALAVGFVMVNTALTFISPGRQRQDAPVENKHRQPSDAERVIDKVREINRRPGAHSGQQGFDALGVLLLEMRNDNSPISLVTRSPALAVDDDFAYARMITRAAHLYDASFGNI